MASTVKLIPSDESLAALTVSTSGNGIWLDQGNESMFPTAALNEQYAESPDTEGAKRMSYKPANPAGTIKVNISGETAEEFRTNVDKVQRYVYSMNNYGGQVEYTPSSGVAVTYTVRSISVASMPQDAVWLPQNVSEAELAVTYAPYGSLAPVTVFEGIESTTPVTAFDIGEREYERVVLSDEPALYWRLGASGITDKSGKAHNGTAQGGINVGASLGALAHDADGSTTFDGIDDRITSSYSPYTSGSTRTTEGWAYRANTSANHTLVGGSASEGPQLKINSGGQNVVLNALVPAEWANAWPGVSQWVHWALIVQDIGGMVELFINGVSQGVRSGGFPATPGNFQIGTHVSTTEPFSGKMDEVAIYERRLSPERIFAHFLAGNYRQAVTGSAPALVNLTITDTTGTNRDYFVYGLDDNFQPYSPSKVLLDAPGDVTPQGGVLATRVGAYSATGNATGNVLRMPLSTRPLGIGSLTTAAIGKIRVTARIYGGGPVNVYVRLSWRIGEGQFSNNDWVLLSTVAGFYDIDLGVINAPKVAVGSQQVEGVIQAYSSAASNLDLDSVTLFPLTSYGKSSAESTTEPSASPVVRDSFEQTAGALNGKVSPVGGAWTTGSYEGSINDFAVNSSTKTVEGSITLAQASGGQWGITASPSELGPVVHTWDAAYGGTAANMEVRVGGIVRFTNYQNFVFAYVQGGLAGGAAQPPRLVIYKYKSGIGQIVSEFAPNWGFAAAGVYWSYTFSVDEAGVYSFSGAPRGANTQITYLSGQDPDMAAGGRLEKGSVGVGHSGATTSAGTGIAYLQNVACFPMAKPQHVMNKGKALNLTSSSLAREPSSGTVWTPEVVQGGYPKLSPGRNSRLVVRSRRNNVDSHTDAITSGGSVSNGTFVKSNASGSTSAQPGNSNPAGITTGTLLLGTIANYASSAPLATPTIKYSGFGTWPLIRGQYGMASYWWNYAEAQSAATLLGFSEGGSAVASMITSSFTGVDPTTPINVSAANSGATTAVTFPSVTTTVPNCTIVCVLSINTTTKLNIAAPSVTGFTQIAFERNTEGTPQAEVAQYLKTVSQTTSGATGTFSATLATAPALWVAHTIAIAPAPYLDGFKASLTITPRVQLTGK